MPAGYGSSALFTPLIIYTFYRAYIQLFYIPIVLRKRRALREYPWRLFKNAPHGLTKRDEVLGKQLGWFEFPNPTRPEEQLPMVFPTHWAVGWWHRRMAPRAKPHIKAQIDVVWMAGDPRIVAVIAASTSDGTMPRRFRFVTQQTGTAEGLRPATDWGATPEDIERARRVGIMPSNR
ncbi:hypothetical protein ACIQOU_20980 [Streptomyces sp. NPDC091279]|uniref:hypothetical protein n=1 Tax=unclassified Streptomyces TaxID=2593676 RepID=UPI0038275FE7